MLKKSLCAVAVVGLFGFAASAQLDPPTQVEEEPLMKCGKQVYLPFDPLEADWPDANEICHPNLFLALSLSYADSLALWGHVYAPGDFTCDTAACAEGEKCEPWEFFDSHGFEFNAPEVTTRFDAKNGVWCVTTDFGPLTGVFLGCTECGEFIF